MSSKLVDEVEPVRFEFDDEGAARRIFIGAEPSERIEYL